MRGVRAFWKGRDTAPSGGTPAARPDIDSDWLEQHVFSLPPELAGAAYDRRITHSEVAAVLSRLCGECKLASRVAPGARGWNNLELWLLVEREELSPLERELVDSLFLQGKSTSADAIQHAYRTRGFEPAAILRRHLQAPSDAALGIRPALRWARGLARESARGLALRQNLATARAFFAAELERPEPRLRDEWLPYLIALELAVEVDRWHQAFGRIETAARKQRAAHPAAADERPSEVAWTGGAGALAGRGASGPWIAATAGLSVKASSEPRGFFGSPRRPRLQLEHA
jgi:hypothetical protein